MADSITLNDTELKESIIKMLKSVYTEASQEEILKQSELAVKKLNELSDLFNPNHVYENIASGNSIYRTGGKYQWDQFLYAIKNKEYYTKALHLITEILDILRGEPLQLSVYKIEKNDEGKVIKITNYQGKEADVSLISKDTKYGNKFVNEIQYLKDNLEKEEDFSKHFIRHYEKFENIAISHFQKNKNFNQGHIIEAYQRHLMVVQHENKFKDNITPKHVAIMLYYSTKNAPWWTGGDIGMTQVKNYNNQRLASKKSIRMVANRLIHMAQSPKFFEQDFYKIFTPEELDNIGDSENLQKYTLNQLLDNQLKRFNTKINININS